jgi:hypothetical protein
LPAGGTSRKEFQIVKTAGMHKNRLRLQAELVHVHRDVKHERTDCHKWDFGASTPKTLLRQPKPITQAINLAFSDSTEKLLT